MSRWWRRHSEQRLLSCSNMTSGTTPRSTPYPPSAVAAISLGRDCGARPQVGDCHKLTVQLGSSWVRSTSTTASPAFRRPEGDGVSVGHLDWMTRRPHELEPSPRRPTRPRCGTSGMSRTRIPRRRRRPARPPFLVAVAPRERQPYRLSRGRASQGRGVKNRLEDAQSGCYSSQAHGRQGASLAFNYRSSPTRASRISCDASTTERSRASGIRPAKEPQVLRRYRSASESTGSTRGARSVASCKASTDSSHHLTSRYSCANSLRANNALSGSSAASPHKAIP